MSYKKPIKEGEFFLAWCSGKQAVVRITRYEADTENKEIIHASKLGTNISSYLSRARIIEQLTPSEYPEYFL